MKWTSILAIYALFWVMSAFVLLPFGVKTADEAGVEKVPGQADIAPVYFPPRPSGPARGSDGGGALRPLCRQLY